MFIRPLYNQSTERPFRWSLQIAQSGEIMDRYWLPEDHYTHWTDKTAEGGSVRDVLSSHTPFSYGNFTPMRRKIISFLTTYHRDFYEDGKYTEVYNDPLNYILADSINHDVAYTDSETRIGNYRMGVRRHITHLGGTISEDELDMLEDKDGVALTSFPLMPPLPVTDYAKPFRTKLISSDVGYVDYVKAAHSSETTTARYAHRAEQGTGFRRFVFDAGNTNMAYQSTNLAPSATDPINSVSKVSIKDIETVADAHIADQIAGTTVTKTLLPIDGEDILVNFAGQNVIRSDKDGIHLEVYNDVNLTTLVSLIDIDNTQGDITIAANLTTITITASGDIAIDAAANDVTLTAANLDVTGNLLVSGDINVNTGKFIVTGSTGTATSAGDLVGVNLDMSGTAQILGVTTHGV